VKSHARVVVVGGGVLGVGLLYHLTREGWRDVVLCEKGELTSGSTWHAAGLVPHFNGSLNVARIHFYGSQLYQRLEAETGQATGWHGCGALRLAVDRDQADWYHAVQGMLAYVGAECHLAGPDEVRRLHPLLDPEGVVLAAWTPGDGHTDPSSVTHAMAIGARQGGAEIYRHTRVVAVTPRPGGEWLVATDQGDIVAEHVVNAGGCFAPQVGAMVGVTVPVVNMVHQYLVTEPLPAVAALDREPPVVRDPRASCYYRLEGGGLLIGPYEMDEAQPWGLEGIDWSFDRALLPPDLTRLAPWLERAARRIPVFGGAGILRVVSGLIPHTPDANLLLGPAAGRRNFWLCCGSGIGIAQGPGAGKYLAQWMVHGQAEISMREFDPRRFGDWAAGAYGLARAVDEYQQMYQVRYPGEYREAGRPVTTSPLHAPLARRGAVFAEVFGWERPKWFDARGEGERYSFRRSNAFEAVAEECRAVRERVGVLDLTSFAKFDVTGRDAPAFLDRLCARRIPARDGRVVLTHLLTERGGIECEMTVTRLGPERFYLLSAAAARLHDRDWLTQHVRPDEEVRIADVTDRYGVLVLAGPRSRDLLGRLTRADLATARFPWMSAQEIEVQGAPTRALRVSYVGELGWELHAPVAALPALYDAIRAAGTELGAGDFGTYAVNALRMEKAFRAWGTELTTEVTLFEADMARFVHLDKPDFVGRAAMLAARDAGPRWMLAYLAVDAADADPVGNEPVYDGGRLVGITTGGAYGHSVKQSLAFAYVEPRYAAAATELRVGLLGERRPARVLARPAYDPDHARLVT
jgi:dimethylglycine dehydrogenase